jgi:hypothetical protein
VAWRFDDAVLERLREAVAAVGLPVRRGRLDRPRFASASVPATSAPREAANAQNPPVPQPTSRTRVPAPIAVDSAMASQAGKLESRVIA